MNSRWRWKHNLPSMSQEMHPTICTQRHINLTLFAIRETINVGYGTGSVCFPFFFSEFMQSKPHSHTLTQHKCGHHHRSKAKKKARQHTVFFWRVTLAHSGSFFISFRFISLSLVVGSTLDGLKGKCKYWNGYSFRISFALEWQAAMSVGKKNTSATDVCAVWLFIFPGLNLEQHRGKTSKWKG